METKEKWAVVVHGGVGPIISKPEKIKQIKYELKKSCITAANLLKTVFIICKLEFICRKLCCSCCYIN